MPSEGLKVCAAMNRKKIMGSQRNIASAVIVLALPASRSEVTLGFSNNSLKPEGPPLLLKAKITAANSSTKEKVQMRANSSSENSQRALMKRELSKMSAMGRAA